MLEQISTKIFADGADLSGIFALANEDYISGFTTNPTLMRAAGVSSYVEFAKSVLREVTDLPVSFEVFADDLPTMEKQAMEISSWGGNVNVKIPIMNTKGELTLPIIESLSSQGVSLNITALMTAEQVLQVSSHLNPSVPSIISVFAGRVADTGRDPIPLMLKCLEILKNNDKAELLWASPREVFNIIEASRIGCHIITVSHETLKKLVLLDKDLDQYSQETVQQFYGDAVKAGYEI
mgnify:CR=1 FL=1|tara:strand:+ start:1293 stop:2003 length:711 start_codon:yes stop_codon:yes gene_type:complete